MNAENSAMETLKGNIVRIPMIDKTLSVEGKAADAKAVGEALKRPTDQYTGDGSSATRTINTNSTSKVAMVYSSTVMAFVTPVGALCVNRSSGSVSWKNNVLFADGTLTINEPTLNVSGTAYRYQTV